MPPSFESSATEGTVATMDDPKHDASPAVIVTTSSLSSSLSSESASTNQHQDVKIHPDLEDGLMKTDVAAEEVGVMSKRRKCRCKACFVFLLGVILLSAATVGLVFGLGGSPLRRSSALTSNASSACPKDYQEPVCGEDGSTYGNACLATASKVTIRDDAGPCPLQSYEGSDGADGLIVCTAVYEPVCGINSHTYSNACYAKVSRVAIRYHGACEDESTSGGTTGQQQQPDVTATTTSGGNPPLSDGSVMTHDPTASDSDHFIVCTDIDEPVCGIDGHTYKNKCFAQVSRVAIMDYDGPCHNGDRL